MTPGGHGLNVHEFGDLTESCKSVGVCFNPHNKEHGSRDDINKHVGDFGNIEADQNGEAVVDIRWPNMANDNLWTLNDGPNSIIGRALVVCYMC